MLSKISNRFHLSLGGKLNGIIVAMLLPLIMAVVIFIRFEYISIDYQRRITNDGLILTKLLEVKSHANLSVLSAREYRDTGALRHKRETEDQLRLMGSSLVDLTNSFDVLERKGAAAKFDEIRTVKEKFNQTVETSLVKGGQNAILSRSHNQLVGDLDWLINDMNTDLQKTSTRMSGLADRSRTTILLLALLGVIGAACATIVIRTNVLSPIKKGNLALDQLAKGNYDHPPLSIETGDEMEELGNKVNTIAATLSAHVNDTKEHIRGLLGLGRISLTAPEVSDEILLDKIAALTIDSLGAITAVFMVIDPETKSHELHAAAGEDRDRVESLWFLLTDFARDYAEHGGNADEPSVRKYDDQTFIVPLIFDEELLGAIAVSGKRNSGPFGDLDSMFLKTLAEQISLTLENSKISKRDNGGIIDTVRTLVSVLELDDLYWTDHSEKVAGYAVALARKLGLEQAAIDGLEIAARVHDVGKIGIPHSILHKQGRLTNEEYSVITEHPATSARIIEHIDFAWPDVVRSVRHHHERFDGNGYPDKLCGEEIPLGARILAIADGWDAMTTARSFRRALSIEQSIAQLVLSRGTQYDPDLVDAYFDVIEALYPARQQPNSAVKTSTLK